MVDNGYLPRLRKLFIKLTFALLLLGVTQCGFLPEQTSQVDADLSDNNQPAFQLSLAAANGNALESDKLDEFLQVVANDLMRSGHFDVTIEPGEQPTSSSEAIESDNKPASHNPSHRATLRYISRGKVSRQNDKLLVDFDLYIGGQAQKISSYQRFADSQDLRSVAHRVADNIFQTLLGVRGPFSTKLCFVTAHGDYKHRIYGLWISDADGKNKIPLYSNSEPIMSPTWSPDGKQIAFIAFKKHDRQGLFIYDLQNKSIRELKTLDNGLVGAPSWSPNSEYLAFTFIKNGNADVYALVLHGDEEIRLTDDDAIDTEAVWMPDSRTVIFTSDRAGTPQLYQVNLDGSELTRVTYNGRENAQASVSPLAKNIAMIHKRNGRYHIALLNRHSKKLTVLTNGREDESPSFSPGGSMILYSAVNATRSSLNIVSSNGKTTHILDKFDDVRQPRWSPLL